MDERFAVVVGARVRAVMPTVLDNQFETTEEAGEFLRAQTSGLPDQAPSIPAAAFISADIAITFPETSWPQLLAGLWAPQDLPSLNHGLLALTPIAQPLKMKEK